MPTELCFTGSSHVFACGGGVSRQRAFIIHNSHQLWRGLVCSCYLCAKCTLPRLSWWHLTKQTHIVTSCIYIHINRCTYHMRDAYEKTVQLCAHASTPHRNWHPLHKQKPKQAFPVISAPSESIWWIECLEVLPLTDGARILNVAQNGTWHHSEDMCTHLHKKKRYSKKTHTLGSTH